MDGRGDIGEDHNIQVFFYVDFLYTHCSLVRFVTYKNKMYILKISIYCYDFPNPLLVKSPDGDHRESSPGEITGGITEGNCRGNSPGEFTEGKSSGVEGNHRGASPGENYRGKSPGGKSPRPVLVPVFC